MKPSKLWPLAGILLASISLHAAVANPEQIAADAAARAFFAAAKSHSIGERQAFLDNYTTPEMRARSGDERLYRLLDWAEENLRGETPDFEIALTLDDTTQWRVIAEFSSGNRIQLDFKLREGKMDSWSIDTLGPDVTGLSGKALADRIDRYIQFRADHAGFSGAVILAQGDQIIFGNAYGFADNETERKNTLDTPFNLASMNKMFTGIAIAQLVETGKLNWDDKVGKFLPDFPNAAIRDKVTVSQLLTHTAGIGSYWNPAYFEKHNDIDTLPEYLATFVMEPLLFEPGTANRYSNGGPVILGLIIEKLSGMGYYEYMRRKVFQAAGMRHADYYYKNDMQANFAIGYDSPAPDAPLQSHINDLALRGSPAGGGYASARDLLAFAQVLAGDNLLKPETMETLWQPRTHEQAGFDYGYLWGTNAVNGRRWVGHNGGSPGVSTDFRYFPENEITVIVLTNRSRAARLLSEWLSVVATNLPSDN